jgi:predicted nucleic acid-binding protein
MILADTSVWVQHLRAGEPSLVGLLMRDRVLIHPFIIGELALGSLAKREMVLDDLNALPQVSTVEAEEVLLLIEQRRLFGTGLGYVDANLLASTLLRSGTLLWTFDRRLRDAARKLGVHFENASQ